MERQMGLGLTLALSTAMLLGCSGASDVGNNDKAKSNPPIAWAKALNHQPTSASDGNIRLTVRAGSEVFVNGVKSFGPTVPVLKYDWRVSRQPAGHTVELLKRNESTVSFRAPQTNQEKLDLQLTLTVTDSNGVTDDALVDVTVVGVPDPNAFFSYGGAQTYTIVAVTKTATTLTGDVPFNIEVERRISYFDLNGRDQPNELVLDTQTLSGEWLREFGTDAADEDCGGFENPRFTLPLPALNADEVLEKLAEEARNNGGRYDTELASRAMDPARIDEARVTLWVRLTAAGSAGSALPAGAGVCVPGVESKPASDGVSVVFQLDDVGTKDLTGLATVTRDTRESAEAYYQAIDTGERARDRKKVSEVKEKFSGWLEEAGFSTNGATDWNTLKTNSSTNSSAHAVYLNNYDLGFGRDMYMRVGDCDEVATDPDSDKPTLGGELDTAWVGKCDVYGVVVNYGNLEAAVKNLGPVLAVAMEYSRRDRDNTDEERITKFYTYAPDRTGDFKRVLSANLDGRGEKFLPQACTVCHGGSPGGLDADGTYADRGNVNAGFISWDLDAFLYSDNDPYFAKPSDPFFPESDRVLAETYTREKQQEAFKKLNQLAYLTFADPDRFALARELAAGWYRDETKPDISFARSNFNSGYVPPDWKNGNGVPGNPADAETIYKDVFAQNCRMCHVLQDPKTKPDLVFKSYSSFVGAKNLNLALAEGRMPFARMTMDRFWLASDGQGMAGSAGDMLQRHLGPSFSTPGTPQVIIEGLDEEIVPGKDYPLNALSSRFLTEPLMWGLTCINPDGIPCVPSPRLVRLSENSSTPVLVGVESKGIYTVTLQDAGGALGSARATRRNLQTQINPIPQVAMTAGVDQPVPVSWTDGDSFGEVSQHIVNSPLPTSNNPLVSVVGVTTAMGLQEGSITLRSSAIVSQPATIEFFVADSDGDRFRGSFQVVVGPDLSVANETGYSETWRQLELLGSNGGLLGKGPGAGAEAIDLSQLVTRPEGNLDPVRIELFGVPTEGTASLEGTSVRYLPLRAHMSIYYVSDDDRSRMGAPATVKFKVCYERYLESGKCPLVDFDGSKTGTLTIETVARVVSSPSWAGVYEGMFADENGNCDSCHKGVVPTPPETDADPNWMGPVVTEAAVFDSACSWRALSPTGPAGSGQYIVRAGDAAQSALNQKPRGGDVWKHRNLDSANSNGTPELWKDIQDWINDGAYFTTSARPAGNLQKCPQR